MKKIAISLFILISIFSLVAKFSYGYEDDIKYFEDLLTVEEFQERYGAITFRKNRYSTESDILIAQPVRFSIDKSIYLAVGYLSTYEKQKGRGVLNAAIYKNIEGRWKEIKYIEIADAGNRFGLPRPSIFTYKKQRYLKFTSVRGKGHYSYIWIFDISKTNIVEIQFMDYQNTRYKDSLGIKLNNTERWAFTGGSYIFLDNLIQGTYHIKRKTASRADKPIASAIVIYERSNNKIVPIKAIREVFGVKP